MAHHQFKDEAQRYVSELLGIVNQLDGPEKMNEVRASIREAGKVSGRVAEVVRELTSNYAPERKDRWEEIIRKTDEARKASAVPGAQRPVPTAQHAAHGHPPPPAGGRAGAPVQPSAAAPPGLMASQPAQPPYSYGPSSTSNPVQSKPPYSTQQTTGTARPAQPSHPSQQPPAQQPQYLPTGQPGHPPAGSVGDAPFPHASGGHPAGIRSGANANFDAGRGRHKKPANDRPNAVPQSAPIGTATPPALSASVSYPAPGGGLGRPAPGPGAMPPAMHAGHGMGAVGVGVKRPRDDGDGGDAGAARGGAAAGAMHHMPATDKMDAHINRIYRVFALQSLAEVKKRGGKGAALDPRRLPDAAVRALLRRAW